MAAMVPGDTVIIADGDWSTYSGMTITNDGHLPPSGTDLSNMTTIRAETDFGVRLSRLADLGTGREYIVLRGLIFPNKSSTLYGWKHSKIIRCAYMGPKASGNVSTFSLVGKSEYNLVEECIAWGGGRYKFLDYLGHHNIFRRNIARHDWYISPEWKGQESNFRGYATHDDIWQNNISIDSDRIEYQTPDGTSYEDGDFWVGDQLGAGGNILVGNIAVNGMYQAYYLGGTDSGTDTVELTNNIALGPSLEGTPGLTGAITFGTPVVSVTNSFFYRFNTGVQQFIGHNTGAGSLNMVDSVARDVASKAGTPDYMAYYSVTTGNYGPNSLNIDPFTNGLLYPVRVEQGSPLATAGSNGGPIGPTILKKVGASGTLHGESGWDTVTNEDIWPFPNEDKINELMSSTVEGVPGIYGFTAYVSPFGSPNTLTSYIWEYLGNKIPCEIYSACGQSTPAPNQRPTATANANLTSGDSPLSVSFTGGGTDTDGTIASYSWNFGDGGTSTEQSPNHTYINAGN